ncbi:MAG: protein-glutamate O-methyltransferase CheR [Lachnospiraceae bacterium]|nr:protein-glutamate O-methyltransferase CheR [Lachnospiraceae bacterium]
MEDSYEVFKEDIFELTNIDLNAYKERQMKRRIDTLIRKCNITKYKDYVALIKSDSEKYEEFVNYLTINVSEFYRNPEQWNLLEKTILPELIQKYGKSLKIWSAACSTGDEPYSLVMLLAKFMPLNQIEIIATDLDKQVMEKAKAGLYSVKSLKGLPEEYVKKYFEKINDTTYSISEDVKKRVKFQQHNLLKDAYPDKCDLIVCRNVMIYFTEEAKLEIYAKFNKALKDEGILFVGSTEQIVQPKELGFTSIYSFFYKKKI